MLKLEHDGYKYYSNVRKYEIYEGFAKGDDGIQRSSDLVFIVFFDDANATPFAQGYCVDFFVCVGDLESENSMDLMHIKEAIEKFETEG